MLVLAQGRRPPARHHRYLNPSCKPAGRSRVKRKYQGLFCSADRDRSCVHALTSWSIGLGSCRSLAGACLNSKMYGQAFRGCKDHLVVKDSWLLFGAPAFRLSTNAGHPFRFYLSDKVDLIFWFCSGLDASRAYSRRRGISRAVRRRLFVFANKNTNATDFDNGPS
jgi:hypothetical protein